MDKTEHQKRLAGLYVVTDRPMCLERSMSVDKIVALAIAGGARIIQYRNKQSPKAIRLYEAEQLAKLCKKLNTTLLINDDVDIAIEVNADGVHLGQEDTGLAEARARLGPDKIIGITCHNDIELARRAQAGGADYVAFGRFFPSLSKPSAPAASVEILQQAHQELDIPICAIGGITLDNAPELIKSGADMIAVVNAIFGAWKITQAAKSFSQLFDS